MEKLEQEQLWKQRKQVNSITTYFFIASIITCFILNQGFYLILLFLFIIIAKSILGLFFENENQKAYIACLVLTNVFYLFSSMLITKISKNANLELQKVNWELLENNEELAKDNDRLFQEIEELVLKNQQLSMKSIELTD
jgi:hypothetical protein